MTQGTGGGEGRWPFEGPGDGPSGGSSGRPSSGASATGPGGRAAGGARGGGAAGDPGTGRRRPPTWLLAVLGVVVVGAVVAVVVLLTGDRSAPATPAAQTVTLPPPTPAIAPIDRPAGTPFADALPATVLQFALTEQAEDEGLLAEGALEGYRLTYSDGGSATLTVVAGQWRDAAEPAARLAAVLAGLGDVPEATTAPGAGAVSDGAADGATDATDGATAEPVPGPEQGPVTVDGQDVGRYVFAPNADGTGTIWWTNATVLIQVDGPWQELRSVFAAFPL